MPIEKLWPHLPTLLPIRTTQRQCIVSILQRWCTAGKLLGLAHVDSLQVSLGQTAIYVDDTTTHFTFMKSEITFVNETRFVATLEAPQIGQKLITECKQ